uniref:Uncharacterized protein n=1 Tax=Rhipicephalus appendiculatus TaxID=34631 RepID=A0A131YFT6_RHIAP
MMPHAPKLQVILRATALEILQLDAHQLCYDPALCDLMQAMLFFSMLTKQESGSEQASRIYWIISITVCAIVSFPLSRLMRYATCINPEPTNLSGNHLQ